MPRLFSSITITITICHCHCHCHCQTDRLTSSHLALSTVVRSDYHPAKILLVNATRHGHWALGTVLSSAHYGVLYTGIHPLPYLASSSPALTAALLPTAVFLTAASSLFFPAGLPLFLL